MVGELGSGADRARGNPIVHWRVLLGAALMTVAAGGVVFAHRAAQQPPNTRYLVVTEEVSAGDRVEADMLGSVAIDLPEAVGAIPAGRSEEVVGRVAAHTLAPSSLVADSDLAAEGRFVNPQEKLVPVLVDPARLRRSSISPGTNVHVLTTLDGTTSLVTSARVASIGDSETGSIGTQSGVLVELAVADMATSEAVTNAAVSGTLTFVLPSPSANEES